MAASISALERGILRFDEVAIEDGMVIDMSDAEFGSVDGGRGSNSVGVVSFEEVDRLDELDELLVATDEDIGKGRQKLVLAFPLWIGPFRNISDSARPSFQIGICSTARLSTSRRHVSNSWVWESVPTGYPSREGIVQETNSQQGWTLGSNRFKP